MGNKFYVFLKSLLTDKKYIKFALIILAILAVTSLSFLLLFETAKAIVNFIKNYHVEIITMIIMGFAAFGMIAKHFNKTPSSPIIDYDEKEAKTELEGAGITYEQIVHPNMLIVLRELAKYHSIYEPTASSILPPNPTEGIIDKKSHMLFEVRVKLKKDFKPEDIDRLKEDLESIIKQKLRRHELVNLDSEWYVNERESHAKIMIDSISILQDSLFIFVAICGKNYLQYLSANPRRTIQKRTLFEDIFKL